MRWIKTLQASWSRGLTAVCYTRVAEVSKSDSADLAEFEFEFEFECECEYEHVSAGEQI